MKSLHSNHCCRKMGCMFSYIPIYLSYNIWDPWIPKNARILSSGSIIWQFFSGVWEIYQGIHAENCRMRWGETSGKFTLITQNCTWDYSAGARDGQISLCCEWNSQGGNPILWEMEENWFKKIAKSKNLRFNWINLPN